MKDDTVTLRMLRERVADFVSARNWDPYHHPKELSISVCIEAAELLEVFQWDEKKPIADLLKDRECMARVKDEVADVLIYLLSMANQLNMELSDAVLQKLSRNEKRYPAEQVRLSGQYRQNRSCPKVSGHSRPLVDK